MSAGGRATAAAGSTSVGPATPPNVTSTLRGALGAAAPLWARVAAGELPPHATGDAGGPHTRWRQALGAPDDAIFAMRAGLLAGVPAAGLERPPWEEELEALLARSGSVRAGDATERLVAPFVALARERLGASLPRRTHLPAAVLESLLGELTERLAHLAGPVLEHERSIRRARAGVPALLGTPAPPADEGAAADPSLAELVERYPVLGRRLTTAALRHAEGISEMLARLHADRGAIAAAFPAVGSAAELEAVSVGQGDHHAGSRSVRVLRFHGGARVVYKPRSCALEHAYFRLLPLLRAGIAGYDEPSLTVLDRGTHGWMEHVPSRECADADEVARFFRSAGRLAATAHALAGADLHFENVVASGPHCVPVDLEMLCVPETGVPESGLGGGLLQAYVQMKQSVMELVILPTWVRLGPRRVMDLGGISGDVRQVREIEGNASPNVPRLNGHPVDPAAHRDDFLAGFAEVYRWFLAERDRLLAAGGPLGEWASLPVRFINRSTQVYGKMLEEGRRIACWRDGLERSLGFERLFRALPGVPAAARPAMARMIHHEVLALEEEDVPSFRAVVGSRDLALPDGEVLPRFFARSGAEAVRHRLAALSESDLATQTEIVRLAMAVDQANRAALRGVVPAPVPVTARGGGDEPDWAAAAREIGERVARRAYRTGGSTFWMSPQLLPGTPVYTVAPMSHGLYEGMGGVALFLAALHRVDGSTASADLARDALRTVRAGLTQLEGRSAEPRLATNVANGIAGAAYLLTLTGELLDEPELTRAGIALLPRIEAGIAADTGYDLLTGSAGAILALLAVARRTGEERAVEVARRCGEHLLSRRIETEDGFRMWDVEAGILTGLSHGAGGFAMALERLAETTGEARFSDAAAGALRFERARFLPDAGNWADLRPFREKHGPMTTWCHGAPGIALSRLALPRRDAEAARELEIALATTRAHPLDAIDHLCCGNVGRLEIVHEAGARLGRPELCAEARAGIAGVVRRGGEVGAYGCFPTPARDVEHPGLFQGIAGIGYALLRLEAPGVLPSVLLLE